LPSFRSTIKFIPIINSTDHLLNQAKICLDNKIIEDRLKTGSAKFQTYLVKGTQDEEMTAEQRRLTFAKLRTTMTSMDRGDHYEYLKKIFFF